MPLAQYYHVDVLLQHLTAWVQQNATIEAVRAIEQIHGGSFDVKWQGAAISSLYDQLLAVETSITDDGVEINKWEHKQRLLGSALRQMEALRGSTIVAVMTFMAVRSAPLQQVRGRVLLT